MNYQIYNGYANFPVVYTDSRLSNMNMKIERNGGIPLLYHRQPPSPEESPNSSTSGSNYGQQDIPIGDISPITDIPGYPSPRGYNTSHPLGQGYFSSGTHDQAFGISRSSHTYGSVGPQYFSPQPHSSPDSYMSSFEGESMDRFVNFDGDESPDMDYSSPSPAMSDYLSLENLPLPSTEVTEEYLRKSLSIPAPLPLNLSSLPDIPPGAKLPKVPDMIKLAIWGSPKRRLTLRQIHEAVEQRYTWLKDEEDKPWQRSVRHNLSLKAMFIRTERPQNEPGKGFYWILNVLHGDGNKRHRKRRERKDEQHIKQEDEEDIEIDFPSESQSDMMSSSRPPTLYLQGGEHQSEAQFMGQNLQGMYNPSMVSYNMATSHSHHTTMTGAPFSQDNSSWGTPSMSTTTGVLGLQLHGDQSHDFSSPQHDLGDPSRRSSHMGGSPSRSASHHSIRLPQIQLSGMQEEGSSHSSRYTRRRRSDTSPDDEEEIARRAPRQRSSHRS